jgi:hypothetical protein
VAGKTPVSAQQSRPAAPDSTKAPQHKLPVSGAGSLTMAKRTPTAAVKGPGAWENGRDTVSTPSGKPPLRGTTAVDVHPCPPGASDCP